MDVEWLRRPDKKGAQGCFGLVDRGYKMFLFDQKEGQEWHGSYYDGKIEVCRVTFPATSTEAEAREALVVAWRMSH